MQLARLSPEDPELMPELGPQTYQSVNAYVESTADLDPEARASAVRRTMTAATAAGKPAGEIFTAGFLEANARVDRLWRRATVSSRITARPTPTSR